MQEIEEVSGCGAEALNFYFVERVDCREDVGLCIAAQARIEEASESNLVRPALMHIGNAELRLP